MLVYQSYWTMASNTTTKTTTKLKKMNEPTRKRKSHNLIAIEIQALSLFFIFIYLSSCSTFVWKLFKLKREREKFIQIRLFFTYIFNLKRRELSMLYIFYFICTKQQKYIKYIKEQLIIKFFYQCLLILTLCK